MGKLRNIKITLFVNFALILITASLLFLQIMGQLGSDWFLSLFVINILLAVVFFGLFFYARKLGHNLLLKAETELKLELRKLEEIKIVASVDKETNKASDKLFRLRENLPSERSCRSLEEYTGKVIKYLSHNLDFCATRIFALNHQGTFDFIAGFALVDSQKRIIEPDVGIAGRVVTSKRILISDEISEKETKIVSGLGAGKPKFICYIPLVFEGVTVGIVESFLFRELKKERLENSGITEEMGRVFSSFLKISKPVSN